MKDFSVKVYLDVDGTVVDSADAMAKWYNKTYGGNAVGKDIYEWNAKDQCPELTVEDIHTLFESDYFFNELTPIKDAQDILERMSKFYGYDFYFCSIGTPNNIKKKVKYLKQHFPFIDKYVMIERENVVMGKDKYVCDGVLIDDNQDNLNGSAKYDILFKPFGEKQWNKDFRGIVTTKWIQVPHILNQIYVQERDRYAIQNCKCY